MQNPWSGADPAAPYDQKFYVVMNVAVGGVSGFFPDGVVSVCVCVSGGVISCVFFMNAKGGGPCMQGVYVGGFGGVFNESSCISRGVPWGQLVWQNVTCSICLASLHRKPWGTEGGEHHAFRGFPPERVSSLLCEKRVK